MELVVKSASLLTQVGAFGRPSEEMKILEMSLNKQDSMMEKNKLVIFKVGMLYVIIPLKVTKIEVRIRNVIINSRPRFEAISKFVGIYLNAYEEQDEKYKEEQAAWEEEQRLKAIEEEKERKAEKKRKNQKVQSSVVPIEEDKKEEEDSKLEPLNSDKEEEKKSEASGSAKLSFPPSSPVSSGEGRKPKFSSFKDGRAI